MKVLILERKKKVILGLAGIFLLLILFVNSVGYFLNWKYISVFAALSEVDRYEVQSRLLMDAMNYIGVCNPDDAVDTWAKGLSNRSAALQYAVMTPKMKKEYAGQLESMKSNWVTGVSSPWVESYEIIEKEKISPVSYRYKLRVRTATSSGPFANYSAAIDVVQGNNFWQIDKISADNELFAYTFLKDS